MNEKPQSSNKVGLVGQICALIRNISGYNSHEREIARLNRLYATLSAINQNIVRVTSRRQLFQQVCKSAVAHGGFKLAWIGWAEPGSKHIKPVACAGEAEGYLETSTVTADDNPEGRGPVGLCLREGKACVFNDLVSDDRAASWRKGAVAHGLRSVAAFPIHFDGKVCGALAVYSDEPGIFRDKETALLAETAVDISFALDHLAQRQKQQQAEEVLRHRLELQNQLANIATTVPGMIYSFRLRPDGSMAMPYASAAVDGIFGMRLEDVRDDATKIMALIHPDDAQRIHESILVSARTMKPWHEEFRVQNTRRGEIWIEGHSVPQVESDGSILWHGFLQDVTHRKRAVESLLESEARYRVLINTTATGFVIVDGEGRVMDANDVYVRLTGHERLEEILGRSVLEWTLESERERNEREIRKCLELGSVRTLEINYVDRQRKITPIEINATTIQTTEGLRILTLCRDITERKQAEESLRQSERILRQERALLRALLDSIPDLIFFKDKNSVYLGCNKAFENYSGMASGQLVGKTDLELTDCKTAEFYRGKDREMLAAGTPLITEEWIPFHSGGGGLFETLKTPYRDEDGEMLGLIGISRDITDRKRAETALRESEERLKLALAASRMGVWEWDLRTNTIFWSPESYAIVGVKQTDTPLQLETFTNLVHPEDRERVISTAHQAVVSKTAFVAEFRLIRPDGRTVWLADEARCTYDADGKPLRLLGIVRDITEHKQAEENLRKLSRAVEQSPASVVITNQRGDIEYVNPKFTAVTGYALDEVRGKNPRILKSNTISSEEYQKLWQTIKRGETWRGEFHNRKKNGELFSESASISPVTDESGRITHFLAVKEDITERKQAEAALRESERRLRDMLENVQMVTLMLDEQGRILFCNEYLLGLTGWQREEVLGRDYFEIFLPAEVRAELRQVYQSLIQGGLVSHYENEIITRTGKRRLISWNNTSLKNMTGQIIGVASIGEDITERKQLEAQLRQAQKMEAIGQLAGGVAHDFNNILAAMMMQLGLLQQRTDLEKEISDALGDLNTHAERAAGLTRQLLLFGRRSVMQTRILDLNEVVENLLKMLRRLIGEDIKLEWRGETRLAHISADAGMLEQVVMNLVVNARDAMPKGGRLHLSTETVEVTEQRIWTNPAARPGRFVCLRVEDTGHGMDETTLKRIFEPFFTTKPAGKGTGLGLATIYGIVSQHGGWVSVYSEVNKGTSFKVYLPAVAATAEIPTAPKREIIQGGSETVLLVEDDAAVRVTISAFLKRWGYRVLVAANGVEAMKLWDEHQDQIELLFSDMVMPEGVTGLELAQKLRSVKPDLKVIISSGYSADLLQQGNLAAEKIMYVPKPCPAVELSAAIRRCLGKT